MPSTKLWHNPEYAMVPHSWDRQYPDIQFTDVERHWFRDSQAWWHAFQDSAGPSRMPELVAYTVPVDLDPGWAAAVHAHGQEQGLAALYNTGAPPAICAVFRPDVPTPPAHRRIRVTCSQRITLYHHQRGQAHHFLLVEAWDTVEPLQVYDVPDLPGRDVPRIVEEALSVDEHVADALVGPLIGSPIAADVAGIHAGMNASGLRARQIQGLGSGLLSLLPPELQAQPSAPREARGAPLEIGPGIKLRFAEHAPQALSRNRTLHASAVEEFLGQVTTWKKGEDNLHASLRLLGSWERPGSQGEFLPMLAADTFPHSAIVDLIDVEVATRRLERTVDSPVHAAIARARLVQPDFGDLGPDFGRRVDGAREYVHGLVEPYMGRRDRDIALAQLLASLPGRMMRNTLRHARLAGANVAQPGHVKAAHDHFIENLHIFEQEHRHVFLNLSQRMRSGRTEEYRVFRNLAMANSGKWTVQDLRDACLADPVFEGDVVAYERVLQWCRSKSQLVVDARGCAWFF